MKIFVQLGTLITFVQCSENNGASIMVLQNKAHSTPVYFKISMLKTTKLCSNRTQSCIELNWA